MRSGYVSVPALARSWYSEKCEVDICVKSVELVLEEEDSEWNLKEEDSQSQEKCYIHTNTMKERNQS